MSLLARLSITICLKIWKELRTMDYVSSTVLLWFLPSLTNIGRELNWVIPKHHFKSATVLLNIKIITIQVVTCYS
jgi:hypothetical protein